MPLPAIPPLVKTLVGVAAGSAALDATFRFGPRLFRDDRANALMQQRAAFTQASLNRIMGVGLESMFDVRGALLDERDQFLADTIGQTNTRMSRMNDQVAEMGAFRDLLFGRADMIRASAVPTTPHPIELMAGIRGFLS